MPETSATAWWSSSSTPPCLTGWCSSETGRDDHSDGGGGADGLPASTVRRRPTGGFPRRRLPYPERLGRRGGSHRGREATCHRMEWRQVLHSLACFCSKTSYAYRLWSMRCEAVMASEHSLALTTTAISSCGSWPRRGTQPPPGWPRAVGIPDASCVPRTASKRRCTACVRMPCAAYPWWQGGSRWA